MKAFFAAAALVVAGSAASAATYAFEGSNSAYGFNFYISILFTGEDTNNDGAIDTNEITEFYGSGWGDQDGGGYGGATSSMPTAFYYKLDTIFGNDPSERVSFGNPDSLTCDASIYGDKAGTFNYVNSVSYQGGFMAVTGQSSRRPATTFCDSYVNTYYSTLENFTLSATVFPTAVPTPASLPLLTSLFALIGIIGFRRRSTQ